jgi:predicted Zn-dependent protease
MDRLTNRVNRCASAAGCVVLALGLAGCALLPGELGLQSVEKDKSLGREMAVQVAETMGLFSTPALETELGAVGDRLSASYPNRRFQCTFRIVDQPEANAFAVIGGGIYVTRGLLALTNGEEELAGVLAHEISHVEERHTAKGMAQGRLPALLALPGHIVGGVVSRRAGALLSSPFEALGALGIARFSRSQELEADDLGARLAASSGYSPEGLPRLLARLERDYELATGKKPEASFLDSHPMTPDRVEKLEKEARTLTVAARPPVSAGADEYLRLLDGLVVGPNPAAGVVRERAFLHPDMDIFLEFPANWKIINSPSAAGAMAPDKDALLLLTSPLAGTDPVKVGREAARAIEGELGRKADSAGATELNGFPAYQAVYTERGERQPVNLVFIWVAYRGAVLPFVSIATDTHKELLRRTLATFRPLTSQERKSITVLKLRVFEARAGEDLAAFCARTGNRWDVATTAAKNGLDAAAALRAGQHVKAAIEEPYAAGK